MAETFLDGRVTLHCGDVREVLRTLPENHFDCVVTSPPYWGLRDYGVVGQLGLERTLGEHLAVMVDVFREVRRVLKPTGTLWLNYGDCYAASVNGRSAAATKAAGNDDRTFRDKPFTTIGPIHGQLTAWNRRSERVAGHNYSEDGRDVPNHRVVPGGYLKSKDLCMVPNRLAIALQEDGWWVRSEIIWHKPNPMPESTRDRPTSAHEKIWLLTKRERYYYDADAIREECESGPSDLRKMRESLPRIGGKHKDLDDPLSKASAVTNIGRKRSVGSPDGRNARNVWTLGTQPFPESHFATFPPELAERCIKAGSPAGGLVLDPFGGAGTTGLVAVALGRQATLIELNPDYCQMARTRIEAEFMGKDEAARYRIIRSGKIEDPGPLFNAPVSDTR